MRTSPLLVQHSVLPRGWAEEPVALDKPKAEDPEAWRGEVKVHNAVAMASSTHWWGHREAGHLLSKWLADWDMWGPN